MLPREEAAGLVAEAAFFFAMAVFSLVSVFLTTVICGGAETGVFGFFAEFLTDFLAAFFGAGFFAAFLAFLATFFAFFAATLDFFARFFVAATLAARCDAFVVFFFFEGFLLATMNSLSNSSTGLTD